MIKEGAIKPEKEDVFKQKFKYYKAKKPLPSLSEVLLSPDCNWKDKVTISSRNITDGRAKLLGLRDLSEWNLYSFVDFPGLLLIKNPFTSLGQRYWIRRCLEDYPRKPNKLNIDTEMSLVDWWSECFQDGVCNRVLQKKLRWTTLGYHHNWDTKIYSDDNMTPFPSDLAELSDVVAGYLGYYRFRAQAAIVNYYHMDSTLSPHTDHSEVNLEAPLLSFSFGQSAIFLIGGEDKSKQPSAILLNSGDIIIMSKEARLCYHAVPKILPSNISPWNNDVTESIITETPLKYISDQKYFMSLINKNVEDAEWTNYNNYVEQSRINMNVRQVLNESQSCLTDKNCNK